MKTLDIIIYSFDCLIESAVAFDDQTKAEAGFNELCETILGDDWEEFKNIIDAGQRYQAVKNYLSYGEHDILWLSETEMNAKI